MDIDFEALMQPVDGDGGAEPDLSDDDLFITFDADVEGFLPTNAEEFYYGFRQPNADIEVFGTRCLELLDRSRDLRLIVVLAKLAALAGNLTQVAGCIALARQHLQENWEGVQPGELGGTHNLRAVSVERFDDFASFVLPLQYVPLISDRNGRVCYRDQAVAAGTVMEREDETYPSASDIDRLFERCDVDDLVGVRDITAGMAENLNAIAMIWAANAENPPSLAFRRLSPLVTQVAAFMQEALEKRDPSLAGTDDAGAGEEGEGQGDGEDGDGATPAGPVGKVTCLADAKAALEALSMFFERFEPSSPGYLLTRKAISLVGLTMPQVIQQIAPDKVYTTHIQLGPRRNLALPMERLTEEFSYTEIDRSADGEPTTTFEAPDRPTAIALMGEIATWYKKSEPSNPIPLLLERARELMTKDFSTLLTELAIPEE
ncbi:MAG: type VI secretion system ImpA family N-terminal domain-containing protein [Pseudomonadota bacterium]